MGNWSAKQVGEVVVSALCIIAIVAMFFVWLKRSRDPKPFLIRLGITAPLLALMYFVLNPLFSKGGYSAVGGVFFTVAFGWTLAILWVPHFTGVIGGLFGNLYDGDRKST